MAQGIWRTRVSLSHCATAQSRSESAPGRLHLAELRDAQLWTVKTVSKTGLAVTIDVGDSKNLHPPRKAEIGDRLALWALGTTYGRQIVYSGPIYESMKISGNEVHIR